MIAEGIKYGVGNGHEHQRQYRRKGDAEYNDDAEPLPEFVGDGKRDETADGGECCRNNGPETVLTRLHDRLEHVLPHAASPVYPIDEDDGIIHDDTGESYDSDKAHDGKIVTRQQEPGHGTQDGKRQRRHDGEGLKEGIELGHKNREDQDKGHEIGKPQTREGLLRFHDIPGIGNIVPLRHRIVFQFILQFLRYLHGGAVAVLPLDFHHAPPVDMPHTVDAGPLGYRGKTAEGNQVPAL